jgi:hypothetical protein
MRVLPQKSFLMTYKGVVKENTVILPEDAHLPNGTVVEVTVAPTPVATEREVSPEELAERQALVARMKIFGEKLRERKVNLGALILEAKDELVDRA